MPRDAEYLAVYDISDDRERDRVSQTLEGYGIRVQKSAFELRMTRSMRERLLRALGELELKTGFIYIYRLRDSSTRHEIGLCPERPFDESHHAWVL